MSIAPPQVITVCSATVGCGKTLFATNMAQFLAHQTQERVVLVDLDAHFGGVATALPVEPRDTIVDAVGDGQANLEDYVAECLLEHHGGFSVLAAPAGDGDRVRANQIAGILRALADHADYVVVDTPRAFSNAALSALAVSTFLYALSSVDLPSLRTLRAFLRMLDRLGLRPERTSLILNKAEADVGVDLGHVSRLFPQGINAILPYDRRISRPVNAGIPITMSDPDCEISRTLRAVLSELLPEQQVTTHARFHRARLDPPTLT